MAQTAKQKREWRALGKEAERKRKRKLDASAPLDAKEERAMSSIKNARETKNKSQRDKWAKGTAVAAIPEAKRTASEQDAYEKRHKKLVNDDTRVKKIGKDGAAAAVIPEAERTVSQQDAFEKHQTKKLQRRKGAPKQKRVGRTERAQYKQVIKLGIGDIWLDKRSVRKVRHSSKKLIADLEKNKLNIISVDDQSLQSLPPLKFIQELLKGAREEEEETKGRASKRARK